MKSKKIVIFLIFLAFILLTNIVSISKTEAQSAPCGTTGTAIATGLVSTPTITGDLVTSSGACVEDPKAAFAPFKIPTYDDLKSIYYDQSKVAAASKHEVTALPAPPENGNLYHTTGNIDVLSRYTAMQELRDTVAVIFIDGNLNIGGDIYVNSSTSAMVFVVKGKINISPAVERIDAVLISDGIALPGTSCDTTPSGTLCYSICTSSTTNIADPCPGNSYVTARPLLIVGSLISLNPSYPIRFRRSLGIENQTTPAEEVDHRVKYLVILRNLLSDTYQKWSEIQ